MLDVVGGQQKGLDSVVHAAQATTFHWRRDTQRSEIHGNSVYAQARGQQIDGAVGLEGIIRAIWGVERK